MQKEKRDEASKLRGTDLKYGHVKCRMASTTEVKPHSSQQHARQWPHMATLDHMREEHEPCTVHAREAQPARAPAMLAGGVLYPAGSRHAGPAVHICAMP